eukprot:CAMPEP_0174250294 /NCGR_PEP_ID=MMETSP0439-20130205/509_1 /TAXON_ID=0 /ORGANISM="Stereomyxa ramosa, Strain Chinc5" /LENGTH=144 /DNA_ID=CAMNT_0015330321 /DNA_START=49 /DNA_END=483 /DNA_ORIENTATION=+
MSAKSSLVKRSYLVLAYGTLKQGFKNHTKMMGGAQFVGTVRTEQKYPLVTFGDRNVPYLLPESGEGKQVEGELYLCDEQKIKELDAFEGAPTYYKRVPVRVETLDGQKFTVDAYMKKEYDDTFLRRPFLASFTRNHDKLYKRRT